MSDAWSRARRVLCVRLDNMGDVLMTTPAIRAIRAANPVRHITLLGSPSGVRIAAHVPEIDETICYDAPWVKNARTDESGTDVDRALIETLAMRRFDAAVIFTAYSQSPIAAALACRMAGIPLRLAHCRENPYLLLTDWVVETEPARQLRHEVERQLDLVARFAPRPNDLRLSFRVLERDRASLAAKLRETGVDPAARRIVVHPGASAPSRRWPAARFAQTVRELARRQQRPMVLTGDASESALVAGIVAAARSSGASEPVRDAQDRVHDRAKDRAKDRVRDLVRDFSGRLTLGELGALIEGADLLVANNTGPVHIAAALGIAVVDLYALTNPQHTPWRVPARVLHRDVPCRNCYRSVCPNGTHACLAGVEPQEAVDAALALLPARRSMRELEFSKQES